LKSNTSCKGEELELDWARDFTASNKVDCRKNESEKVPSGLGIEIKELEWPSPNSKETTSDTMCPLHVENPFERRKIELRIHPATYVAIYQNL
jgi:hypothetical protein